MAPTWHLTCEYACGTCGGRSGGTSWRVEHVPLIEWVNQCPEHLPTSDQPPTLWHMRTRPVLALTAAVLAVASLAGCGEKTWTGDQLRAAITKCESDAAAIKAATGKSIPVSTYCTDLANLSNDTSSAAKKARNDFMSRFGS